MKELFDLTHPINPDTAQRKFSIETIGADSINHNVVRDEGQWYIMTNIQMVSHIATHIEVPYHLFPDGKDLAAMPVSCFSGPAILLDFSDIQNRVGITKDMVVNASKKAGGIQKGDIVLCNLGYSDRYGEDSYGNSPFFLPESLEYLIDCGMKMMGVDAGGVELPGTHQHENHSLLFSHDIPLIENVAHLNILPEVRFEVFAYPFPIVHVEAIPVRVVAAI